MINENSNRNNDPQFIDLKLACRNNDTEDIKRILEEQPNLINEIVDDFFGMTVLLLACVYDWDDIFKYLVTNSNSDTINLQDKNGRTALYFAVNKGKFKHVKLLLSRASINVNIPCGGFDKPVLWYCRNRQCFELLLPHYPDLDEHGKKMALLWYLCRYGTGRVTEVQELMDAVGNDILSKMSHDVSVMVFLAAAGGNADIIQYLLSSYDKLIDINIQDKDGQTPLYEAVKAGSLACVKLLLVHPKIDAIINYEYQLSCALFLAVWNFNAECVKTLLEHPNIKVNEIENVNKRDTPLSQAVFSGSVDCVKELLSHPNIDVNMLYGDEFDKPVLWNCRTRECYDLLLPHYVTLSEDEKTMAWIWNSVFTINYEEDDPKELKTLMKKLSLHALQNMKQDVSELVLLSASNEKPKTLKYLVKRYRDIIDINIKDKNGNTPLYQAVRYQQIESLGILLSDSKIDLNILCGEFDKPVLWYCWDRGTYNLLLPRYPTINKFEKTMTQLWYLCRDYNQPGLMEIQRLIASIPPNILSEMRNDVSVMVLIAATAGKVDIIKYLLSSYGDVIDVNIQDKSGRTSLHRAILSNSKDCISTLVEVVDGTIQDKNGKTARELEDISTSTENSLSLSVNQPYVKWNRFKIMLVGQGRAGKTALANNLAGKWKGETTSTIGAEQMDMQLFYGGVEGGILQKYETPEHEFESFLAEQYHRDKSRVNNRVTSYRDRSNSAEVSLSHRGPTIKKGITSQTDIESTRSTSLNVHDINLHAVDSHYRTLQEIDTSSSYKLILVDFGGQSIFNVLHAFFMSKHGIYLVVFDMTLFLSKHKEKQEICRKELKFWLKSITMYTSVSSTQKTAPLAIVGTRGDKVRKKKYHQISQELEEMFGEMKVWQSLMWYERDDERLCFFPNDNTKTQNNIVSHQLLLRIEQSLGEITGEKEEIDVIWIKVFDEMKRFHKVYVPFEQVVNIAQQKLGRREREGDMKVKGLHANKPENVEKDRIKEEVRKMLRFLNDIGMILWIEEKGLDDDIILDPIEYLVKPATTIICKHLATKDDPYQTIHEIPEIHQACKLAHKEDWMRMLESGLVSDELARDILMKYYHHKNRLQKNPLSSNVLETSVQYNLEKVLPMMIKFGLMVPLFSPSIPIIPPNKKLYFIPSLLPADPLLLHERQDPNHEKLLKLLQKRHKKMEENWNIGMCYSLFCFLPMQGLSIAKTASCDVISSAELSRQGFLPSSLFERLLCRYMQRIDLHHDVTAMDKLLIDNELITGFRGRVQLSHKRHRFRMIERREENRIEVMIQSYDVNNCLSSTDKEEEKEIFQEIHRMTVEIIESLLRECYEGLLVKTLLPLPSQSSPANIQGFVTLRRVRSLLSTSDPFEDVKTYDLNSNDMECEITLQAGEMKKDPYWSVWREKVKIATLPFHSSSPSPSPPLPLRAGKKTHVFLSHDWGIDGNNHNRVKQVSEALKSRGLITWIDDERIVNEIDEKIIDGLNQTMGLAVFVTENYVKKLNSGNHQDYCKKEFHYGIKKLTPEKMIFIVLDKAMKDQNKWSDSMTFNLPSSILYFDLSEIFEQSSNLSEKSVKEKMDNLCQKIATVVELESVSKENDQKSADNDQGGLLTVKSFCFCCVILFVMTFLIYSVLRV